MTSRRKDILWLLPPPVIDDIADASPESALFNSHLASIRLRTAVAVAACQQEGHRNLFVSPNDSASLSRVNFSNLKVCVVGKLFIDVPSADWLAACLRVKESGALLILDICEYPFAEKPPEIMRFYEVVLPLADMVTVNSGRMAEMMAGHMTGKSPVVIEDAILSNVRRPEFVPGKVLELLWFGHISNVCYLERMMDALLLYSAEQRCRLHLVSIPGKGLEQAVQRINANFAPRFEARFTAWSLESMRMALRRADLVLIPGDPTDPLKSGVSSNRLAEALQAGRMPVASPLSSYQPFAEAACLGDDLVAGIRWTMANRGEVLVRIRRGQALVAERLAQESISQQWIQVLEAAA